MENMLYRENAKLNVPGFEVIPGVVGFRNDFFQIWNNNLDGV